MGNGTRQFSELFPDLASHITGGSLEAFLARLVNVEVSAGESLLKYGRRSDTLYLIRKGSLEIVLPAGDAGVQLGEVRPGQLVGEISMIDPGPASATVHATADSAGWALTKARFDEFAAERPSAAAALLRELSLRIARRIRAATASLISVDEEGRIFLDRPAEQRKPRLLQMLSGMLGLGEAT